MWHVTTLMEEREFEITCWISSWKKERIHMWNMWLQLCSENYHEQTCQNSSWGEKPYKCEICDIEFAQKPSMAKHVASIHEKI